MYADPIAILLISVGEFGKMDRVSGGKDRIKMEKQV
jgi:hypothetical protein